MPETASLAPKNAYGACKAAGELYCRVFADLGLNTQILRLTNVYGTRDFDRVIPAFIENALNGRPLTLYGGGQILDFIWIGKVIDALMAAGFECAPNGPINVGSGQGTRIGDLARRVLDCTHSSSSVEVAAGRKAEVVRFVADVSMAVRRGWHNSDDPLAYIPDLIDAWHITNAKVTHV